MVDYVRRYMPTEDRNPVEPPWPVVIAFCTMLASATLGVVSTVIASAVNRPTAEKIIREAAITNGTPEEISGHVNTAIAVAVILMLTMAAFWIWLATKCSRGRNWARVVALVWVAFCSIAWFAAPDSGRPLGQPEGMLPEVAAIAIYFMDLFAVILLWIPPSRPHFVARPA
jgi:hypothetical protein